MQDSPMCLGPPPTQPPRGDLGQAQLVSEPCHHAAVGSVDEPSSRSGGQRIADAPADHAPSTAGGYAFVAENGCNRTPSA